MIIIPKLYNVLYNGMIMGESWDISEGYGICLTIEFRGKPLTPVIYHDFPSFSHIFPMSIPHKSAYHFGICLVKPLAPLHLYHIKFRKKNASRLTKQMLETPLLKHFPAEFHLQVELQPGIFH